MSAIIEIKKLTKYYRHGKVLGVKDLNLKIQEGEIFGFIGPNGAGKSTTIRLLLDLIRPTSGQAAIFGLDTHHESVRIKEGIGYLPGEIFLPESLTGEACINYYRGFKHGVDNKYLAKLMNRFDFDPKKRVREYSKGNKQKLAIILALMAKPKLLLLDEPTSGLDPLNQQEFYSLMAEIKSWNATVFLSTHILTEAEKVCDRVGIIKSGKLLKVENIEEVRENNIRHVTIETTKTIPLTDLKIGEVVRTEKTTNGYRLTTAGKLGPLLKVLASHDVVDITVSEPSLEEIFMHYYKD